MRAIASATVEEGNANYPAIRAFRTIDYGQTWTNHQLWVDHDHETNDCEEYRTACLHALDLSEARLFYRWGYFDTHDGFASAELMNEDEDHYFYPGVWSYFTNVPTRLNFSDDIHGCPIGMNGYAVITDDGGETWRILDYGMDPDHLVYAVDGVDTTFYVTSDRGIVYKRCLVNGPQSVMEGASPKGITVNPTLTDGVVTVSGESLVELQVYNTLGQRVLTLQPSESIATIDLTGQPAGMYFISVTDQNGVRCVKKIVKQ